MNIDEIPVIAVSYNSAELIEDLLSSLRDHYPNPVTIIDGSSEKQYRTIEAVCAKYPQVRFIHFDYNIHHGPGMAWAFENLNLKGPALVLDSDVFVLKRGFLESMMAELKPSMYGVGYVNHVNEGGFDVDYEDGAVRYLHPACMLVNLDTVRRWPMPTKHGAPMIEPMLALHRAGQSRLIQGLAWVKHDFGCKGEEKRHFIRHDWQGTVKRNGSYGLDEWLKKSIEAGELRAAVQSMLPKDASKLFELGDNNTELGRACKEARPHTQYHGAGPHPDKASVTKGACDALYPCQVDALNEDFLRAHADTDCWILDQALEISANPEQLLTRIRKIIHHKAAVVAVIPNAQHWSLLLRMIIGDMAYSAGGLLSTKQRRWFSQASIFELFTTTGFEITQLLPVSRNPLRHVELEQQLRQIAQTMGQDSNTVFQAMQTDLFVIKAIPC